MTNKHGLPEWFCRAVEQQNAKYTKGGADFSVTGLIGPAYMARLLSEHKGDLQEDVVDSFFSFRGHMAHAVVEASAGENDLSEERIQVEIEGYTISGKADLYIDGIIYDVKSVLTSSALFPEKQEHEYQLNMYAYLYRSIGFPVTGLRIGKVFVDWQNPEKSEKHFEAWYPKIPIQDIEINLWSNEQCEDYILARLKEHVFAKGTAFIDAIPICSPDERWAKPDKWKVVMPGKNRAEKGGVYSMEEPARAHAAAIGAEVIHQPGKDKRCMAWCKAAPYCRYYKEKYVQEKSID